MAMVETKFKQTEIGLIPEDWEVIKLRDYCSLKNGYAFPSINFSNKGPIVMTPGNFKLDGGLKFDENKTIRYKGDYNDKMRFFNGDLVMVMTDLTPDCNLLGKSGIINTTEIILHNQRIGKIVSTKNLLKNYLSAYFNSEVFSNRMKNTATGSTVRHTSTPTILNTILPLPPLPEQQAIAEVLSDTDTWIESLEQLIAKKQLIKQGAMQKLLTPREDWEVRELGDVIDVFRGGSPRPIQNFITNVSNGINWIKIGDTTPKGKYIKDTEEKIIPEGEKYSRKVNVGDFLLSNSMSFGRPYILQTEGCIHDGWLVLQHYDLHFESEFLYYLLTSKLVIDQYKRKAAGSGVLNLNKELVKSVSLQYPKISEQTRIATILSDMDAEIEALEQKLGKVQQIKQGLMQELLTGRVRLILNN